MKRCGLLGGLAAGLLFAVSSVPAAEPATPAANAAAQDKADTKSTDGSPAPEKAGSASTGGFSYRPPMRGAPAARIGGGTRGIGDMKLELVVLAPDHTGLTTREQPTLYWYVSKAVPSRLEVTVINDAAIDPALEKELNAPGRAGIQSIDLAKTGVKLKPGVEYRWFVSAIADPDQRSNDVVASGTIERITPDAALKSKIAGANEYDLARVYAQAGVWYDTIDMLSRMIEKSPGDAALREQRAELLDQVGLKSVADYTRAPGH
jgi:hypothetical protein